MTKEKAMKCTTHHCCNCHQYKIEQMESALKFIEVWSGVSMVDSELGEKERILFSTISQKSKEVLECLKFI